MTPHMDEWIQGYLEGSLTAAESAALLQHLQRDPEAMQELLKELRTDVLIREAVWTTEQEKSLAADPQGTDKSEALTAPSEEPQAAVDEEKIHQIKQYAEKQLQAFLLEQAELEAQQRTKPKPSLHVTIDVQAIGRKLDRFLTRAARTVVWSAVAVAVMLSVRVAYHALFPDTIVATLGEQIHAQWSQPLDGNDLRAGWLRLDKGYAQLKFIRGAQVLLQAPCKVKLLSPTWIRVASGSLNVQLAHSDEGFTVDTPTAHIEDFGTEFGIHVGRAQQSEIHVFDGKVGVRSHQTPADAPLQMLPEGQAAWTTDSAEGLHIGDVNERAAIFTRVLSDHDLWGLPGVRLDLADVVGGGNGFGTGVFGGYGDATGSINPLTGQLHDSWRPQGEQYERIGGSVVYPMQYTVNHDLPYVDGTFLPDGSQGTCFVSSQKHIFTACPDTDGQTKWNIENGWYYAHEHLSELNPLELRDSAGISLSANGGITFDLERMRDAMPGIDIRGFSARGGIPVMAGGEGGELDVWVLVDGQVRYHQGGILPEQMFDIQFDIRTDERFLTLVATDSQTKNSFHWSYMDRCFFLRPILTLAVSAESGNR